MARGRRPAPAGVAAQKAAVRSTRKVRTEPAAEEFAAGAVGAPVWLKGDALDMWKRLAPRLQASKLLGPSDAETFARYCRNFARWLKMQQVLDANGETYSVETASGTVHRPRPEFLIADRVERQLLAAEDRFGLNPAERQRIMMARLQTPGAGDLFADKPAATRQDDAAATAAEPARPTPSAIGLLN